MIIISGHHMLELVSINVRVGLDIFIRGMTCQII